MPAIRMIAATLLLIAASAQAQTTDFWGTKLPGQPTQFIFGYGSLINTASRNSTATQAIPAIPVRVSAAFGYVRSWSDRSPSGFTALGLRRPYDGEAPMTINGVLYPVDGNDMSAFDAREKNYTRVEVPHALIESVSWQSLPEHGTVWVYVPMIAGKPPGEGLPLADAKYPLVESYIDIVVEGGLEYGPEFAREIIETTRDWSPYWLDDRTLARRPWVADKQFASVDALLATSAPCFAQRAFSEDYAAASIAYAKRRGNACPRDALTQGR
jgi:hypothetical protein